LFFQVLHKQLIVFSQNDLVFSLAKMTPGTHGKHPVFVGSRTPNATVAKIPSLRPGVAKLYHTSMIVDHHGLSLRLYFGSIVAKPNNAALLVSLP
jgi:hypothetical protein